MLLYSRLVSSFGVERLSCKQQVISSKLIRGSEATHPHKVTRFKGTAIPDPQGSLHFAECYSDCGTYRCRLAAKAPLLQSGYRRFESCHRYEEKDVC